MLYAAPLCSQIQLRAGPVTGRGRLRHLNAISPSLPCDAPSPADFPLARALCLYTLSWPERNNICHQLWPVSLFLLHASLPGHTASPHLRPSSKLNMSSPVSMSRDVAPRLSYEVSRRVRQPPRARGFLPSRRAVEPSAHFSFVTSRAMARLPLPLNLTFDLPSLSACPVHPSRLTQSPCRCRVSVIKCRCYVYPCS